MLSFAKYKKNTNGNNKLRKTYDRSDRVNKGGWMDLSRKPMDMD